MSKTRMVGKREYRTHTVYQASSEHGRSTVLIECPFCRVETEAYIWSLNGSGKNCVCGARHGGLGETSK
jgi:hypothetical protein